MQSPKFLRRHERRINVSLLVFAVVSLLVGGVFLRFAHVTDYLYHATVKDPVRTAPTGRVIVAPADGTVLYVRPIADGIIPQVVKKGVAVPMVDHLKMEPLRPFSRGYLIGIYMNTHGVHINRIPNDGVVKRQHIFNGPHMNMTDTELAVILTSLIPGWVSVKKLLGLDPYNLADHADYILHSARETLVLEEERGALMYVVRIADYYVGKILCWVKEGQRVARGQKLGMITWGSQTDVFFEASDAMRIEVDVGDYVYAGETVLASY